MNRCQENIEHVNHPKHYTETSVECIDAMRIAFGSSTVAEWCIITAFKYLWRRECKNDPVEDLEKAKWYLDYANGIIDEYDLEDGVNSELDPEAVYIIAKYQEVKSYYDRVVKDTIE